jgi:hypothetical protein
VKLKHGRPPGGSTFGSRKILIEEAARIAGYDLLRTLNDPAMQGLGPTSSERVIGDQLAGRRRRLGFPPKPSASVLLMLN